MREGATIADVLEGRADWVVVTGDCLEVLPGVPDESLGMVWTDPPYGHNNGDDDLATRSRLIFDGSGSVRQTPIANDGPEEMRAVVDGMLRETARILRCCCCCCCCCGGGPRPTFAWLAQRMDREGLEFFHSVIWDKRNPGLGLRYRRQHEMVMVAHRKGGQLAWRDGAKPVPNIVSAPKPREQHHPNEKPESLVAGFVVNHTEVGNVVLDPFCGSGTTGVACIKTGRRFIGIEIDEGYAQIARRRIREAEPVLFTQAKPEQAEMFA